MIQIRSKITYEDYAQLPRDQRAEVIEGELLMSPAPSPYHQEVLSKLFKAIEAFVTAHALGKVYFAPCDVVLTKHDIVQPDLLFIARSRLSIIGPKFISAEPDLVVEVLSEPSAYRDLVKKKKLYARHRIREYWLVDLEAKRIEILKLAGNAYELLSTGEGTTPAKSAVLSDFSVRPRDVF